MTLQKREVGNDIHFSYIKTDKFKVGSLTFNFCMPLTARDYLLASVLEGILTHGTARYPSIEQLNRHLDMLYDAGIGIQASIRMEALCFSVTAEMLAPRYIPNTADITRSVINTVADILFDPLLDGEHFPTDTVKSEKAVFEDTVYGNIDDTDAYASARLKELMKRDMPERPTLEYLLSGIESITPAELTECFARILRSPLYVTYIGDEDEQKICSDIYDAFAKHRSSIKHLFTSPAPHGALPYQSTEEQREVNQSKLALGFRTDVTLSDRQGYMTAIMLNEIFGASPASKLFLNVRERLGLCYYCRSSYFSVSGDIHVLSGIDLSNAQLAESEILRALDDIREGKISDVEMQAAQKSILLSYTQMYDSPSSLTSFYFIRALAGIDETIEDCRERVMRVGADDIASLAARVTHDTRFLLRGTLSAKEAEHE